MTAAVEVDIDGYCVPAMIESEQFAAQFGTRLEFVRGILQQLPTHCAFRRFANILFRSTSPASLFNVVELETHDMHYAHLKSKLQLRSEDSHGVIGLRDGVPHPARRIGEMTVFLIRHRLVSIGFGFMYAVFGVLPWTLYRPEAFDAYGRIRLRDILRNVEYIDSSQQLLYRTIESPLPLFDLAAGATCTTTTLPITAVLSFTLMWHMARVQRDRTDDELAALLAQRSFRFFGIDPPRVALFSTTSGFLAMRHTVAQLESAQALFVVSQLLSAVDFLLRSANAFERFVCYRTALLPLVNTIGSIDAPGAPQRVAELDFRADLLADVAEISDAEARWMCEGAAFDRCTMLCVSFRLCAGATAVDELLHSSDAPPMSSYAVLRRGRVYLCNESVIRRICVHFFGHVLRESAGATVSEIWQQRFRNAMPIDPRFYADEQRELMFDDCTLQSSLHRAINAQLDVVEFRDFSLRRRSTVTLPNAFDAASLRQLCRLQQVVRVRDRVIDAHTHRLAMLSVAHSDQCHRSHIQIEYDSNNRAAVSAQLHSQLAAKSEAAPEFGVALEETARRRRRPDVVEPVSSLDDIEDLVSNLHANRALPLCISTFAQKLLVDGKHLKNTERVLYYRLLASLEIPELEHDAIVRHMLRATPPGKLSEQYGDVKRFEKMADEMHDRAARGKQRVALTRSSSEISREDALAQTTVAPSCYTMTTERRTHGCPFQWQTPQNLAQLLVRSGVDVGRAEMIADGATVRADGERMRGAREMCRLHMHALLTTSEHDPWPNAIAELANHIAHPRDFTRAVAYFHLERREQG